MNKLLLLALIFAIHAQAGTPDSDSDLSPRRIMRFDVPSDIKPDQIDVVEPQNGVATVEVYRQENDKYEKIEGLVFKAEKFIMGGDCKAAAVLENQKFSIEDNSGYPYKIIFNAPCGKSVILKFSQTSNGGQALGIWKIASLGQAKLGATVGTDFWKQKISFVWPADGDYYNFNTVHITLGHQWDVVGHEFGHAIYDQARLGSFGGGQHKIDQCYSDALALSEGWASFFSAWLSIDLNDPDAKFEYMVPRRKPIRIENVPADVCKGPQSEWRVTSFFWDLIDLHNDGESSNETFARQWKATFQQNARNMNDIKRSLETAKFDPSLINLVWDLNFK